VSNEYRVVSDHPEDLADGRQVGPGEFVKNVDPDEPHNRRLIDDGRIIETKSAVKAGKEKGA